MGLRSNKTFSSYKSGAYPLNTYVDDASHFFFV